MLFARMFLGLQGLQRLKTTTGTAVLAVAAVPLVLGHKEDPMKEGFIPKHGGYKKLLSYQKAEIVYDATVYFCNRFIDKRSRTHDQMVQAARSGKQNVIEGSMASATSKETEIKLTNVARASLEELLADYRDFLRLRGVHEWPKEHAYAIRLRKLNKSRAARYATFRDG